MIWNINTWKNSPATELFPYQHFLHSSPFSEDHSSYWDYYQRPSETEVMAILVKTSNFGSFHLRADCCGTSLVHELRIRMLSVHFIHTSSPYVSYYQATMVLKPRRESRTRSWPGLVHELRLFALVHELIWFRFEMSSFNVSSWTKIGIDALLD